MTIVLIVLIAATWIFSLVSAYNLGKATALYTLLKKKADGTKKHLR